MQISALLNGILEMYLANEENNLSSVGKGYWLAICR